MKSKRKLAEHLVSNKGECHEGVCSECFFVDKGGLCTMYNKETTYEWATGYLALHKVKKYYKSITQILSEYPESKFSQHGSLLVCEGGTRLYTILPDFFHILGSQTWETNPKYEKLIEEREESV